MFYGIDLFSARWVEVKADNRKKLDLTRQVRYGLYLAGI